MHIPVESPGILCLLFAFLFYSSGRIFQKFSVRNLKIGLHSPLLDGSMSFVIAGTFLQFSFISFFYGKYLSKVLTAVEFMLLGEVMVGGSANPLDNLVVSKWNDWLTYAKIPFQILGAFTAILVSVFLWSFTYGQFENTIFSTAKGGEQKVIENFLCTLPISISYRNGFISELLGSMVRLVVARWSTCRRKWSNKTVALFCRVTLKLQGSYTSNYVVNPLILLNHVFFCPKEIDRSFFIVYCIAPTLGSILASVLQILPHQSIFRKKCLHKEENFKQKVKKKL